MCRTIALVIGCALVGGAANRTAAPAFTLHDAGGKAVTLEKLRGKVVLLNFWATWCHGCQQEIPRYEEFHERYRGRGLVVVGVSLDDEKWGVVRPYMKRRKLRYTIAVEENHVAGSYQIEEMPVNLLIDRHGRIAASQTGVVDRAEWENEIRALLAER